MNNVQSEIDNLTKPASVPAYRIGFFARLKTYLKLWMLPRGQRMWVLGFKPITPEDLEQRLSIKLINEKLLRPQINEAIKNKLRMCGIPFEDIDIDKIEIMKVTWFFAIRSLGFHFTLPNEVHPFYASVDRFEKLAVVKYCKLKHYIGDRIPQRCFDDMKRAKAFGVSDFYLAFPVIDQTPRRDPIILAEWEGKIGESSSTMLEISWWE